ncbi:zinc-binding dehydrogenase [Microbispora sp. NPDC049125]|uniref:zinc-binding dehydrogenase n=1 Tax=Microbispora sp. NPDC049125 TaxID=3154929 RepID=UPI003465FD78
MRGFITDPGGRAGLRLADDLPEPSPAPHEAVVEVRAYAVNHDELNLIARRPDGWRPGQDVAGFVVRAAADGSGPAVGTRVACYLDWEGWSERIPVPTHCMAAFHLVLDGIGGPLTAQAVRRIAPGGHLAWYGNIGGSAELRLADFYAQGWNAHIVGFISPVPEETKGEDLAILAALVADGRLIPRIGLTLPWEKTPDALDALARREVRGKAVLTVGDGR